MVPRDDVAGGIERDALVDDVGESVVLPRHLVLARQLHAHRPRDDMRQQRRVVRDGIGAVDPVAARAPCEHDADTLRRDAEERGDAAAGWIGRLRG